MWFRTLLFRSLACWLTALQACQPTRDPDSVDTSVITDPNELSFVATFSATNLDMGDAGHITGNIRRLQLTLEVVDGVVNADNSELGITPGPGGMAITGVWTAAKLSRPVQGSVEWQPAEFQPATDSGHTTNECFTATLESTNPEVALLAKLWGGVHQQEAFFSLSVLGEIEANSWLVVTGNAAGEFGEATRFCEAPYHDFPEE